MAEGRSVQLPVEGPRRQRYCFGMDGTSSLGRFVALSCASWLAIACGAETPPQQPHAVDSGGKGGRGHSWAGRSGDLASDNPEPIVPSGATGAGASGAADDGSAGGAALASCVQEVQEAERVPVDMYIMLDRSSSMLSATGAGPSKWDAIRQALNAFLGDPRSEGLGVGLQYFPLGREGVPTTCTQDSDCGDAGPCMFRACRPPPSGAEIGLILCISDNDCPGDSPGCAPVGTCQSDQMRYCWSIGNEGCGPQDACIGVRSECYGYASCDAADYAAPAVPIGVLPSNARQLSAALEATRPLGLTPTSAALSGALQRAKAQAQAEPAHRVIAVLATDGAPTECPPTEPDAIGALAGSALRDAPSVRTYVIGVFNAMETEARSNLNAWAAAGGTSQAFIIDPGQDVAAQFLDALELIRAGSIACEYLLPPMPVGSALDLARVNVALVEAGRRTDFLYVGDASRCDRAALGWHYDAAPESGEATAIVICDAACDTLRMPGNRRVEIQVGCMTRGPD
jgi:hypothetical protein